MIVEIIDDLGVQVVEGIETLDQHILALDAGTDLMQGFYYARPSAEVLMQQAKAPVPAFSKAEVA